MNQDEIVDSVSKLFCPTGRFVRQIIDPCSEKFDSVNCHNTTLKLGELLKNEVIKEMDTKTKEVIRRYLYDASQLHKTLIIDSRDKKKREMIGGPKDSLSKNNDEAFLQECTDSRNKLQALYKSRLEIFAGLNAALEQQTNPLLVEGFIRQLNFLRVSSDESATKFQNAFNSITNNSQTLNSNKFMIERTFASGLDLFVSTIHNSINDMLLQIEQWKQFHQELRTFTIEQINEYFEPQTNELDVDFLDIKTKTDTTSDLIELTQLQERLNKNRNDYIELYTKIGQICTPLIELNGNFKLKLSECNRKLGQGNIKERYLSPAKELRRLIAQSMELFLKNMSVDMQLLKPMLEDGSDIIVNTKEDLEKFRDYVNGISAQYKTIVQQIYTLEHEVELTEASKKVIAAAKTLVDKYNTLTTSVADRIQAFENKKAKEDLNEFEHMVQNLNRFNRVKSEADRITLQKLIEQVSNQWMSIERINLTPSSDLKEQLKVVKSMYDTAMEKALTLVNAALPPIVIDNQKPFKGSGNVAYVKPDMVIIRTINAGANYDATKDEQIIQPAFRLYTNISPSESDQEINTKNILRVEKNISNDMLQIDSEERLDEESVKRINNDIAPMLTQTPSKVGILNKIPKLSKYWAFGLVMLNTNIDTVEAEPVSMSMLLGAMIGIEVTTQFYQFTMFIYGDECNKIVSSMSTYLNENTYMTGNRNVLGWNNGQSLKNQSVKRYRGSRTVRIIKNTKDLHDDDSLPELTPDDSSPLTVMREVFKETSRNRNFNGIFNLIPKMFEAILQATEPIRVWVVTMQPPPRSESSSLSLFVEASPIAELTTTLTELSELLPASTTIEEEIGDPSIDRENDIDYDIDAISIVTQNQDGSLVRRNKQERRKRKKEKVRERNKTNRLRGRQQVLLEQEKKKKEEQDMLEAFMNKYLEENKTAASGPPNGTIVFLGVLGGLVAGAGLIEDAVEVESEPETSPPPAPLAPPLPPLELNFNDGIYLNLTTHRHLFFMLLYELILTPEKMKGFQSRYLYDPELNSSVATLTKVQQTAKDYISCLQKYMFLIEETSIYIKSFSGSIRQALQLLNNGPFLNLHKSQDSANAISKKTIQFNDLATFLEEQYELIQRERTTLEQNVREFLQKSTNTSTNLESLPKIEKVFDKFTVIEAAKKEHEIEEQDLQYLFIFLFKNKTIEAQIQENGVRGSRIEKQRDLIEKELIKFKTTFESYKTYTERRELYLEARRYVMNDFILQYNSIINDKLYDLRVWSFFKLSSAVF